MKSAQVTVTIHMPGVSSKDEALRRLDAMLLKAPDDGTMVEYVSTVMCNMTALTDGYVL